MVCEERPAKRRRLTYSPQHIRSIHVRVRLDWTHEKQRKSSEALLLLDSGATGSVLSNEWAKKAQVACLRRETPIPIADASGNHIPGSGQHYTRTLRMKIGDHVNEMRFELANMPDTKVDNYLRMSWLKDHNPDINWEKGSLRWRSNYCKAHWLMARGRLVFITSEELLAEDPNRIHLLGMCRYTDEDGGDIKLSLLPEYKDYAGIFSSEMAKPLREYSEHDHRIELEEGKIPLSGSIYSLSRRELDVLYEYINEKEDSGKIRRLSSTARALILFVPKPDGSLRLCIDYKGLNKITIKNKYSLPLMNELRDRLGKATVFTKLDLKKGYYLVRMAPGEEWKTAFKRGYGLHEYTVMPFGLCNAQSTFQSMIDDVFRDMLDAGVIAYRDDILIYSGTIEEHVFKLLVRQIMEQLSKARKCVSIKKSSFHQREVEFLGYKISDRGISMTSKKVEDIQGWNTPQSVKNVQSFMGFANFY